MNGTDGHAGSRSRLVAGVLSVLVAVLGLSVTTATDAWASGNGTPDTAFNDNVGTIIDGDVNAVAVQADGKVVVGGTFTTSPGNYLARFNADGTPDAVFNANVGTTLDSPVSAVAVQGDGAIVVGGAFTAPSSALARFNANGTPDTTFNTAVGTTINGTVNSVAVQGDGAIVVGGAFSNPSSRLARFTTAGTPDTAFNTAVGVNLNGTVYSVTVQADGAIVVGGFFGSPGNRLARFTAAGAPDTTFNTNVGTTLGGLVTSATVQADGNIVVGGAFLTDHSRHLARFTAAGAADTTFNTNVGTTLDSPVSAVAVQADGKIVVGGSFLAPSVGMARFTAAGTPDTTFNTNVGSTINGTVTSVAVQANGKIVVGGVFVNASSRGLARFFASTVPGAPVITSATGGDRSASVAFTPGDDGGAAITDYQYRLDGSGAWRSTGSTSSPVTINGLTNGTPVRIQLRAVNSVGPGKASNTVTTTPRTTPGSPKITAVKAGDRSASVVFTPPASNGGAAISGYQYRLNGSGAWKPTGSTTSPMTITGLTNGMPVGIQLRAVNKAGAGTASNSVTTTPHRTTTTLRVTAKPASNRLPVSKTTKVVKRITSNGATRVRAHCSVRGHRVNRVCDLVIDTIAQRRSDGRTRVLVTPLCNDHVTVTVSVVAKKPGATRKSWTRTWKVAKKPATSCRASGNG